MDYTDILKKADSWESLEKHISNLPNEKARGDAFEAFCKLYLELSPEYRIKSCWSRGRFPQRIVKILNLIGQKDLGIDLIAETADGQLWAIQAKFRSNTESGVGYRELSTFLAISDRADYRLIISNTTVLPKVVAMRSKCGEVLRDHLEALDGQYFERLKESLRTGEIVRRKSHTPRQHQDQAIDSAFKHFMANDRGQLIMACGTGKTLTSVWIAERLKAKKILVLVPSLALMRQTVSVWANNLKSIPLNYLCICSDESVAYDIKNDYPVRHLWEMDIPVTTNASEAREYITASVQKPIIVFSTYQSSNVVAEVIAGLPNFCFDLMICDEAHRTAGITKGLFNQVLSDTHIPATKRLFMTATPRIIAKHILKKGLEKDIELFSMSDEKKYGKEFFRLSFGEAIRLKLLSDYKVVITVVCDKEVQEIISGNGKVLISTKHPFETDANNLAKQIAYLKAVNKYDIKHTISFHSRVASAETFVNDKSPCGIKAVSALMEECKHQVQAVMPFHVNGSMPSVLRSRILTDFTKSAYSVVSNARCLTEGVDIPSVDGVLFFDPKYRLTDIVQATGRAIRLHNGKMFGYLMIPVLLREENNIDKQLQSSDFDQVWSVISAMQSQDERLYDVISRLRMMDGELLGQSGNSQNERMVLEEKLFEHIEVLNIPAKIPVDHFLQKIETRLLDHLSSSWDFMYGVLKAYRKKFPNIWPKRRDIFKNVEIGRWCVYQRIMSRDKTLCVERTNLLNAIGFPWVQGDDWIFQYKNLVEFRKKSPKEWPSYEKIYGGKKLGVWCANQRRDYKNKTLSQERIDLLNAISFQWELRDSAWMYQYKNLLRYRKTYPDRWPTKGEEFPEGNNLSLWCTNQRRSYRGYRGKKLQGFRRDLLNKIGFPWTAWGLAVNSANDANG